VHIVRQSHLPEIDAFSSVESESPVRYNVMLHTYLTYM
jgi:hypothetical protein